MARWPGVAAARRALLRLRVVDQAAHRKAKGSHCGRPPTIDTERYKRRRAVEYRAVATRYDKLAVRDQATVHVAAINMWLRHISNTR